MYAQPTYRGRGHSDDPLPICQYLLEMTYSYFTEIYIIHHYVAIWQLCLDTALVPKFVRYFH